MNHRTSVARLAGALLIVGLVAVACGRHGAGECAQAAGTAPAAETSPIAETTYTPTPTTSTPDSLSSPDSSESTVPGAPDASVPAGSGNDPVVGEIQSIDQLLKGIDGSLSGSDSDSGTSGGE